MTISSDLLNPRPPRGRGRKDSRNGVDKVLQMTKITDMSKSQRKARLDKEPLTVADFAQQAEVTRQTVRNWIEAGKIKARNNYCPAVPGGKYWTIDRAELGAAKALRENGKKYATTSPAKRAN